MFSYQKKGNDTQKDVQGDFGRRAPPRSIRGMIVVMGHKNLLDITIDLEEVVATVDLGQPTRVTTNTLQSA